MRLQNISCRSQTYITVHFKADFRNCKYSYEWTKVYFKGVDVHIPQSFVYRVLVRCNSTHGTKSYKRALKESKADVPEFSASLHTFSPLLRNFPTCFRLYFPGEMSCYCCFFFAIYTSI